MNKTGILLSIAIMTATSSFAAPTLFVVESPSWKQIAVSKNDNGVNIRKTPSTSAPRLMYDENKIDDYETPVAYYAFWSTLPAKGSLHAVTFTGPEAIVSERNGWYEVKNIGPKEESNGWVSSTVCNAVTPPAITNTTKPVSANLTWVDNDMKDEAYCLYLVYDELNGTASFYYGRLKDGFVICPFSLECENVVLDENKQIGISKRPEGYFEFVYNSSVFNDNYEIDMSKISSALKYFIIKHATPCKKKVVFINNNYYCITDY